MSKAISAMVRRIKRGLSSGSNELGNITVSIYTPPSYTGLRGTDTTRLRSDVLMVGKDFNNVIGRETRHGRTKRFKSTR